ncbi:TlpA family protein disulfide reductase [Wenjunlia tyrosinilytica]|uniref:Thiol:disulfide interchange protein n=1 Tax=Wenjunlia tyrosinilytica TaxID=1544741 RepID=A0A918DZJ9_9ACTN|nr:TlpA disulfide reductase family protein [Wenjunlia tyrosinilytica]GGO90048.1 thiol:disulfide interchange protein [Wenjunlia tyrosinilytica]
MRARTLVPTLICAAALVLAGCGTKNGGGSASADGTADGSGNRAAGAADTSRGTGAPAPGNAPTALRFTGTTVEGKPFDAATLAGKPTVLWFWAPWCGTCRGQAPQTAKLARQYRGKVNFLGVAGLDKAASMRDFVSSMKVGGFPHLDDEKGSVWKKFGITEQSAFVLLDSSGRTVHSAVPSGPADLDRRVAGLVG